MNSQSSMPQLKKILVPLDGSQLAEEALPLATQLVRANNAELLLLRVVPLSSCVPLAAVAPMDLAEPMREAAFIGAQAYLEQVITYEHLDGLNVHTDVVLGGAANTIIDYAQQQDADLIVMRSHGETGISRWIMGSTAQQLVRNCPVPVLVINTPHTQAVTGRYASHVLIALDGSPLAEEAIRPAALLSAALAYPETGTIHLTRVVECLQPYGRQTLEQLKPINEEQRVNGETYLKNIQQRIRTGELAPLNLNITTSVVTYTDVEDITKRIIKESAYVGNTAELTGSDIIAMSTHGRHGFQHLLLGSFTEEVLDAARKPLLVVHASKTTANPQKQPGKQENFNVPIF